MTDEPGKLDLGFTDERLPKDAHVCLIFDDDAQRQKLVSEYLAAGLRRGESTRWFVDVSDPADARRALEAAGVDWAVVERAALSLLPATDAYCPAGHFDPPAVIARMKSVYEVAKKKGFTGTRMTGEMTWALRGIPGSERLLEYEALIGTLCTHFPHSGMCQYDSRRFDGATLFKVLQIHPYMVAQGQIVRNPYYVRPAEYAQG